MAKSTSKVAASDQVTEQDAKTEGEEIARETIAGDLRHETLEVIRHIKKPWEQMSEAEQAELIENVNKRVRHLVFKACAIIAADGKKPIIGTLESAAVKDAIKLTVKVPKTDEQRHDLIDAAGGSVLISIIDSQPYQGEQTPDVPDKDQGDLVEDADLYDKAYDVVVHHQKASTSFIQRHLGIGYNRAANIIELLEGIGVVSAADSTGKRKVLIAAEDLEDTGDDGGDDSSETDADDDNDNDN